MSIFRYKGDRWRATGHDRELGRARHLGIFDTEAEAKRAEARWYRSAPKPECEPRREDTSLYRLYDDNGGLLYIGIAGVIMRRFHQHERKPWWLDVASIRVEHFPTREAALEAESHAIAVEAPAYNLRGNAPTASRRPVSFNAEKRDLIRRIAELEATLAQVAALVDPEPTRQGERRLAA